jgi:hypothetical protein
VIIVLIFIKKGEKDMKTLKNLAIMALLLVSGQYVVAMDTGSKNQQDVREILDELKEYSMEVEKIFRNKVVSSVPAQIAELERLKNALHGIAARLLSLRVDYLPLRDMWIRDIQPVVTNALHKTTAMLTWIEDQPFYDENPTHPRAFHDAKHAVKEKIKALSAEFRKINKVNSHK